ncbi:MAG: alpha-E domain-containing protein [Acidimicrobiia bacterium]|nr:alpha-E domain-containing protein [bacterium]MXZ31490.1 alpha-E domain-containing protein [Acidimicrobiia bacterium]MYB24441.1 alpha-E domain-containing protein [Acidimicrobiia bacterium]MYE67501.1 alpha-E domain-containing protein [Acidimicrobiia bacterium]MYJ14902.1 alpha-E domain-containing protein [Acidimicrobiia bacterium]
MILARHADALLWVGRYLERTEATVRCLDYAANSIIHLRGDEARVEIEQLVKTLGLESVAALVGSLEGRRQLFAFLLSDTGNPGSVLSAVSAVREKLRSTRERIPIELWEEANGLYLRFREFSDAAPPPERLQEVLLMVRRACLAISGVLNEGMRRDEGYAFIVIGRMIERSIFTVGLIVAGYTDPRGTIDATRMLRLTSSLQAYHRRHGHAPDPEGAVRYLLFATDLPRSLQSCLLRAEDRLKDIGATAGALDGSRRKVGLLRARLELGEIEEAMAQAPVPALSALHWDLAEVASEIAVEVVPPLDFPTVRSQYLRPGEAGGLGGT